ncbi:MAG: tRNA (adenosine(37)-N6)-dimethylallyltransferase MiaA [Ignavibacteriaceae bacterium]|jgi:tRNA dimethylallyltransferase|nr:tRNA (adenosine(37)-N6)-dimethylallyltransferase MiaA [Ignavibacteriaceae bacterium]MCW8823531.1 tRNA (adenosine(37)-N6)-dimethylallyltransferase MiaA [Ignavibacteriaceae bacterium]MCW8960128.1 tRNA (adenosine(37)-N6)-dimethylallyltransferase MiaA [Ignavibacteriaceae bacterium]MCW8995547.1 tRNA (adenosine(37)-N6)-dimethylallyltransferase MiaA [Psychromonas sp.]MCW9098423.1 tRNA (adenosine(37)-N6)-dimethylallyltransferase MiaA [Ignavibacteriaceae bacterium]
MDYNLITILGPTATGKTRIAAELARDINGEIISADSRQVYKHMDIGTGKDLIEFQKANVSYHLIDIIDPSEEYNLFRFTKNFQISFEEITKKNKIPILVGGTGLYISAVLQSYKLPEINDESELKKLSLMSNSELKQTLLGLKPVVHNKTDLTSKDRLVRAILVEKSRGKNIESIANLHSLNIGIKLDREEIKKRITKRLKERLSVGMIEEVEQLLQKGISSEKLNYFGLEYKFVSQYLDGKLNYNDMFQKLNSSIHNFAKRQMTWFRKMEREGVKINWFSPDNYLAIKNFVTTRLNETENIS